MTRRATKSLPLEVGEFEGGSEYDSLTSTRQNHGKGLRGGFKTITVHIKLPAAEPAFPRVGEIFFLLACMLRCFVVVLWPEVVFDDDDDGRSASSTGCWAERYCCWGRNVDFGIFCGLKVVTI